MTSASPSNADLLRTPLHALHQELGARMVEFAGYAMPVQYAQGLLTEHRQTREHASLFDVSHMGQISISGPHAAAALESILPVDIVDLAPHKQRYALLLNASGGILDDLMVINRGVDYLLIVNASRKVQDLAWIEQHIGSICTVQALPDMALLALQGPQASAAFHTLLPASNTLLFMHGMPFDFEDAPAYATRSGYSGEDGFEIAIPCGQAASLARKLLALQEVQPAGLGARNSLRLEAGLCLFGSDMSASTTPTQAALQWSIPKVRRLGGAREGGFIGAEVVLAQIAGQVPVPPTLRVGLQGLERVPVRDGTPLHLPDGPQVGTVTSGLLSPSLNAPIAMGYVATPHSAISTQLHAMVRGKPVRMEVVPMPFIGTRYRKS
ncbi:MAG: glycine cleavage system aminomethyltransferase GcvT [Comamonas sp.]|nr:glycine cleavage system aminomethyltransferase GcvT [Comamonas sp.]